MLVRTQMLTIQVQSYRQFDVLPFFLQPLDTSKIIQRYVQMRGDEGGVGRKTEILGRKCTRIGVGLES